jgi:hypothetical protein
MQEWSRSEVTERRSNWRFWRYRRTYTRNRTATIWIWRRGAICKIVIYFRTSCGKRRIYSDHIETRNLVRLRFQYCNYCLTVVAHHTVTPVFLLYSIYLTVIHVALLYLILRKERMSQNISHITELHSLTHSTEWNLNSQSIVISSH